MHMEHPEGQSVWMETAVEAPQTVPLSDSVSCDVVVIGGGFTGLSAALELAGHGASVCVLEKGQVGDGASGRNGGQVVPGLKYDPEELLVFGGETLLDFAGGAAGRTFDLISRQKLDCHASQDGWLQPAVTSAQMDVLKRRAEQWQRHAGVDVKILSSAEVRAQTGTSVYVGGWIDPRGGSLQPLSYVRQLAIATLAKGARIFSHSAALAMERQNGGWLTRTSTGSVRADKVLVCTNAYRQPILPDLYASIFPSHSVQVATEPLPAPIRESVLPGHLPVSDARRLLKYMRLDPEGRFMIGGRGSFGARDTGRYFDELRACAVSMFSQLAKVKWTHQWAGKIALTFDHLPHIHNPQPGLYAALGYNGRGVAMGTQIGIELARLSVGSSAEECPLPVIPIRKIPLHLLRRPALEAVVLWYRILDRLGR